MRSRIGAIGSVLALLLLDVAPPEAEACGPKMTVDSRPVRRAIRRTPNPSRVLVVSSQAATLKRDLSAAGHRVETVPNVKAAAAPSDYAVVVVDSKDEESRARARFASAEVFVRSGDNREDLKTLERRVARTVLATSTSTRSRTRVGQQTKAVPVDFGPKPAEPTQRVAVDAKRDTAVLDVPVTQPVVAPSPAVLLSEEVPFARGSARASGSRAAIEKAARWLEANPSARVIVEGHADPTGTPEGNLVLGKLRAEAVRDELVAAGIASSRIDVVTYGDTRLKYGPTDGRNRRVVIEAKK